MTLQIVPVGGGRYAVIDPGQPVPRCTGSYEECTRFMERERMQLCRS